MRTFLAIPIPAVVQDVIQQQQQQLEALLATARLSRMVRWTPPPSVHLTLRFLGETAEEQRRDLPPRLTRISANGRPFTLALGEIGCFPNLRTPAIVWLGLQPADETLDQIQQQIELAVQAVGFPADSKPFRPHLTIGRLGRQVTPPQVRAIGQTFAQHLAMTTTPNTGRATFVVDHLEQIQSQLQPAGPIYTPLQRFTFAVV